MGKTFTEINAIFRLQFLPLQRMSGMEPKHEQDVDCGKPKTQKSGKPHQQERKQTKVYTEPKNSQSCENCWRKNQLADNTAPATTIIRGSVTVRDKHKQQNARN